MTISLQMIPAGTTFQSMPMRHVRAPAPVDSMSAYAPNVVRPGAPFSIHNVLDDA